MRSRVERGRPGSALSSAVRLRGALEVASSPGRAVLLLAGSALVLTGCGVVPAPETASPTRAVSSVAAQPPVVVGTEDVTFVPDPSGSVPRGYLIASLAAFAAAIRESPRPVPARDASPAQPVLHVRVRAINGHAYGASGELLTGSVPAIPGVEALPSEADPDAQSALLVQDRQQRNRAAMAYHAARAQALALADRIGRLRPPVARCSDIIGAISAAAETFTGDDRRLIVASDLAQHCAANRSGSLQGVRVLVVHICFRARRCLRQAAAVRRELRDLGAATVLFARPENMRTAIHAFVREAYS